MPLPTRGFRALIMGPGKDYISNMIGSTFGAARISAGKILRQHIAERTVLGREVKEYMNAGRTIPDHLLANAMSTAIFKVKKSNLVIEGYPRTLAQAEQLQRLAAMDVVINLQLPINDKLENHRQLNQSNHDSRKSQIVAAEQMDSLIRFYRNKSRLYTIAGDQMQNLWPLVYKYLQKHWINQTSFQQFRAAEGLRLVETVD